MMNWLDHIKEQEGALREIAGELEEIVIACGILGLHTLSKKIGNINLRILVTVKSISDGTMKKVDDDYKTAQQSTANMMKACFAINEQHAADNNKKDVCEPCLDTWSEK